MSNQLIAPSFVTLEANMQGKFNLVVSCDGKSQKLIDFLVTRKLAIKEKADYFLIYKPE